MTTLDDLQSPWPEVFELMWAAYLAGTIPVGAVVLDDTQAIVSRGQNRIFDPVHDGGLSGSRIAHAEINALIGLSSVSTYESYTLYTALEPCHMCLAAAVAVRIGSLHYAGADPYGGAVGKVASSADHLAHPIEIVGPLAGQAGCLPELLHVAHFLWRRPEGDVVAHYRRDRPELVTMAGRLPLPTSGASLEEAFAAVRFESV